MTAATEHNARRDQGVAWMNRGHALQQFGDKNRVLAAIQAYAQAIAVLQELPIAENPEWANSLGAAWMNHGQLLYRAHGAVQAEAALHAFDQAAAILGSLNFAGNPWARRNCAGTLLNRACLLVDVSHFAAAAETARAALPLAVQSEREELVDADLALKVRRVLCDAIGRLIVMAGANQNALASEASDLVDDGLAVARQWAQRGEVALQPLAVRLFRFGAQLYRIHQPHFLSEFLLENVESPKASTATKPDPELMNIALENISTALTAQPSRPYLMINDPASERWVRISRELEATRDHLLTLAPLS